MASTSQLFEPAAGHAPGLAQLASDENQLLLADPLPVSH